MKFNKPIFTERNTHLVVIFLICFLFCRKIFQNFNYWGISDWDQHFFYMESAVKVIKEYSQLPLWNPWSHGGMVLFQNSQVSFLTPFTFLYFFLDTPQAMKISILLHYVIALIGMYLLGKKLFKINNFFLILFASSIFVFNSFISLQVTVGHTWILPFAYIPFVFLFFEKYVRDKKIINLILSAGSISLMIFEGGIYPVPLAVLFLIIYSIFRYLTTTNKNYLLALIQLGTLSFLLSSIKLIPLIDYMSVYPRLISGFEIIPLGALSKIFLGRSQSIGLGLFKGQAYGWHEYGCYIGILLLIVFLIALVMNVFLKNKELKNTPLILCLIIFFLLFLGTFHRYAPYSILKKLPVFECLHVSGRFLLILTFIAGLLIFSLFHIVEDIINRIKNSNVKLRVSIFIAVGSILTICDLFIINTRTYRNAFTIDPGKISYFNIESSDKYEYRYTKSLPGYGAGSSMYPALKMNLGTIYDYEPNAPKRGFNFNKPLVFSIDNETKINNIKFTPNKISFSVTSPTKSKIFLNQNYVRGWKFNLVNVELKNDKNKPSIEIEKGDYKEVYFYYFPNSIYLGLAFSIIGIILCIIGIKFKLKSPS